MSTDVKTFSCSGKARFSEGVMDRDAVLFAFVPVLFIQKSIRRRPLLGKVSKY